MKNLPLLIVITLFSVSMLIQSVMTAATEDIGIPSSPIYQASVEEKVYPYDPGSLIALEGIENAAVYYIGDDGKKYIFPDNKTYFTWHEDFEEIIEVSLSVLDEYEDGGVIPYREGVKLITHQNTAKIYAVEPGGIIRWIKKLEIAEDLYGSNWMELVQDTLPGLFSASYTLGTDISDKLPTGTIIKEVGGDDYYYIENGLRRKMSAQTLEYNNINIKYAVELNNLENYQEGLNITDEEDKLFEIHYRYKQRHHNGEDDDNATSTDDGIDDDEDDQSDGGNSGGGGGGGDSDGSSDEDDDNATSTDDGIDDDEDEEDVTPPVISNVQTTGITETSATITWTTDELADSKVSYAIVSIITATSTISTIDIVDTSHIINHNISLSSLTASTVYYYIIVSEDAEGNTITSDEQSFATLTPAPPETPELELTIAGVSGLSTNVPIGSFQIDVLARNATCRFCEHTTPETTIKAYYTPWYPNDGVSTESGIRFGEQILIVPPMQQWEILPIQWSGIASTTGRYYFTAIIDPDNLLAEANENSNITRHEFFIVE